MILSRTRYYYHFKLAIVTYLTLLGGTERCYRKMRSWRRLCPRRKGAAWGEREKKEDARFSRGKRENESALAREIRDARRDKASLSLSLSLGFLSL